MAAGGRNPSGRRKKVVSATDVPEIVIRRLPIYLRAITFLSDQEVITSEVLGRRLDISPAQIRKDLSHFGGFGKQGAGYEVGYLRSQLAKILKVDRQWDMILVGVGDLGHAILSYQGFKDRGFQIVAAFDNDPAKIGQVLGGTEINDVQNLPDVVRTLDLDVAIIAVPASEAQEVANILIESGIRAILNYAPIRLQTPDNVHVYHIDPVVGLQSMTYYL